MISTFFSPSYWSGYGLLVVAMTYLSLVRLLRYRRRDRVANKYGYSTRESLKKMTLDDAYEIQLALAEKEFPLTFSAAIFFALFRSYGIPTISKLLTATTALSSPATASKRAADTIVIMAEVLLHRPTDPRAMSAIARMNYLHAPYRKAGKISDEDMLYTLSLFALQPVRWIARLEWRPLSDAERCAMALYWRDLALAMDIPLTALSDNDSFDDGLAWLTALETWSLAYERAHMLPADSNRILSKPTLGLVLFNFPTFLHGFALKVVSGLLDARLRAAVMLEEPSAFHLAILSVVVAARRFVLRHLALPRPQWMRVRWCSESADERTGMFHAYWYVAHPWYVRPSWWARWGLRALRTRALRGIVPGDRGAEEFVPAGYKIEDVGPLRMRGKGRAEMERTKGELRERRARGGGCPMFGRG